MKDLPALEQLRSTVELNLCEKCKPVYSHLIEPGIVNVVSNYFRDWKDIEWRITSIVMKLEDVFKNASFVIIDLEPENAQRYKNDIDYEKFKEINNKGFRLKIQYLKDKGVLGKDSFRFFNDLRKKRNKIHKPFKDFTAFDLVWFSIGSHIASMLWLSFFGKMDEILDEKTRKMIEQQCKRHCEQMTKNS